MNETLLQIANLDNSEDYLNTLQVIAELMVQVNDKNLAGAQYTREFKLDRMSIKIIIEKKYNHG